jgi:hypothetical protein
VDATEAQRFADLLEGMIDADKQGASPAERRLLRLLGGGQGAVGLTGDGS